MNPRLLLLALSLPLLSCSSGARQPEKSVDNTAASDIPEVQPQESHPEIIPFTVQNFEKEVGENELEVDYPVAGNPETVAAVRTWINQQLGESYRGNLDDGTAFFRHYASMLGTDPDLNEYGGFTKDEFELKYQNDLVVTYVHTSYEYEGGAHGMGGAYGTTFLRSDGSMFDKGCFKSYKPLMPLFIEGLKQYFKVSSDEELLGCLIGVTSLSRLSAPGMEPWIEEGGVVFSYMPYEIAPYSAGSPRFTIPASKLRPYLTDSGLTFFNFD